MTVPKLLIGVVVLSVVAAVAPAAFGADRPDDRAGQIGVGSVPSAVAVATTVRPDDRGGQIGVGSVPSAVAVATSVRPDDRGGKIGVGAVTPVAVVRPDDRGGQIGVGAAAPVAVATPAASTGIDWADPLVIAGLTALLAAAAVAVAFGVVHHRHGGAGTTGGPGTPVVTH